MRQILERHRHLLDFVLASLLRRRGRNSALLVVYIAIVFFLGSALLATNALRQQAAQVLENAPEIVVQRMSLGRFAPVPLDWQEELRRIRGVAEVRERLWGYYYDPVLKANFTLVAVDESLQPARTISIGPVVAQLRENQVGDTIILTGSDGGFHPFEITQILDSGSGLVNADLIVINTADYRLLSGIDSRYATDLTLTVHNAKEFATISRKIVARFPDARPISRDEIRRTYDALFGWRGGLMLLALGTAGCAFLFLVWDRATGLSAEERREIGILKAVGWETSDILLLKFQEGAVISGLAFAIGTILAYVHVFLLEAPLIAPLLRGWSTLAGPLRLTPAIDIRTLVVLATLTVLPYIAVTIVPSWRVAITDPDTVMR